MPFYGFCKYGPLQIAQMCPRTRLLLWLFSMGCFPMKKCHFSVCSRLTLHGTLILKGDYGALVTFPPITSDQFSNCWCSFLDPWVLSKCSNSARWHDQWLIQKIAILTVIRQVLEGDGQQNEFTFGPDVLQNQRIKVLMQQCKWNCQNMANHFDSDLPSLDNITKYFPYKSEYFGPLVVYCQIFLSEERKRHLIMYPQT